MAELINSSVFAPTQKFVDFSGLDYFWGKVKKYVDDVDTTLSEGVATNSAAVAANSSAISSIQDELNSLSGGAGSIATQINNAITALKLPETYETIANVSSHVTALTEAIAAAKSSAQSSAEATAAAALKLHADNTEIHVTKDKQDAWDAAASAITAFLDENAVKDEVVNTLKEIQEYITTDGEASSALLAKVDANTTGVATNSAAIGSVVTKMGEDIATALGTAKTYAEEKATAAETAAKTYADGLAKNYDAAGTGSAAAAQALADAKSYTDTAVTTAVTTAKAYADEKAAAAQSSAIAQAKLDAQEFLKGYYTKSETETKIGESLATAKTYAETQAGSAETAAKAYASQYTNELFDSIKFASEGDIDSIFVVEA